MGPALSFQLALRDRELDLLAFGQRLESVA
jgi:hypothetical protein